MADDLSMPEIARFHAPPGWPSPSRRWVLEHQGMPIPDGWVPRPEYPKAPRKWKFWTLDGPDSGPFIGSALRRISLRIAISFGIMVAGLLLTLIGTTSSETGYVVFWGAVLFGLVDGIRLIRRRNALRSSAMQDLYRRATQSRQQALRKEYSATR